MSETEDIVAHHSAGTLVELIVDRMRRHRADDVGKSFCAKIVTLHNNRVVDVLDVARTVGASAIDQHSFFVVMHVFCDIIPGLEAEAPAMLAAVKALVVRAGDDGFAGMPKAAYRTWVEQGERPSATLEAIDPADPEDAEYVYIALMALSKAAPQAALVQAIGYLIGPNAPARSAGAKAIGDMNLSDPEDLARAFDELSESSLTADDNSLGHILASACEIARSYPEMEPAAIELIDARSHQVGDLAIHQMALKLMFHGEALSPGIVNSLIAIIKDVNIKNDGTMNTIDLAAAKMVSCGRANEALVLINTLIVAHDELASLDKFESFSHSVVSLGSAELSRIVIEWLMSLEYNLGMAAASLIRQRADQSPLLIELDNKTVRFSDSEMILLVSRAIGYLFLQPITAASLIVAIIRAGCMKKPEAISDLLFEHLLINYSGQLASWLKTQTTSAPDAATPVIVDLLARLDLYIEGLRRAGHINEFLPSERERLIESQRQRELTRQIHKSTQKKSVLMSLVSRSVLLYGNSSISYFENQDGGRARSEMKLHTFSHTFESPRLDIIDQFELDYSLRVFRAMRRIK